MERKLSLAQTPLIAASQAGAGTHPNNPELGSAPSRAGKWFSAESHPSLHPVILTNYGNRLWMGRINIPQSLSLRPPRDGESDGRAADGVSLNIPQVCCGEGSEALTRIFHQWSFMNWLSTYSGGEIKSCYIIFASFWSIMDQSGAYYIPRQVQGWEKKHCHLEEWGKHIKQQLNWQVAGGNQRAVLFLKACFNWFLFAAGIWFLWAKAEYER